MGLRVVSSSGAKGERELRLGLWLWLAYFAIKNRTTNPLKITTKTNKDFFHLCRRSARDGNTAVRAREKERTIDRRQWVRDNHETINRQCNHMQCSGGAYVRFKERLEIGIGIGIVHMAVLGGDATLKSLVTFALILDWVWQPNKKGFQD